MRSTLKRILVSKESKEVEKEPEPAPYVPPVEIKPEP